MAAGGEGGVLDGIGVGGVGYYEGRVTGGGEGGSGGAEGVYVGGAEGGNIGGVEPDY